MSSKVTQTEWVICIDAQNNISYYWCSFYQYRFSVSTPQINCVSEENKIHEKCNEHGGPGGDSSVLCFVGDRGIRGENLIISTE